MKMQCARIALKNCIRKFSSKSGYVLEQLTNRSILRLSGNDTHTLLQSLITNDMTKICNGPGSMYAMFLNNKGRVLYDTIVYSTTKDNLYYLEVDNQAANSLLKHLKAYLLRRKIDISHLDELNIWTYFNPSVLVPEKPFEIYNKDVDWVAHGQTQQEVSRKKYEGGEIWVFPDPRLSLLGCRILAPVDSDFKVLNFFPGTGNPTYKNFRYRLGVGEGIDELPPGNCFPLESNGDYLNGVSFHKGCYLGQELTARSHYTGVIRKRLMPITLTKPFVTKPEKNVTLIANGENVGKLRGYDENSGLALVRVEKALKANQIFVNNIEIETAKPNWWPTEEPKDRIETRK